MRAHQFYVRIQKGNDCIWILFVGNLLAVGQRRKKKKKNTTAAVLLEFLLFAFSRLRLLVYGGAKLQQRENDRRGCDISATWSARRHLGVMAVTAVSRVYIAAGSRQPACDKL